MSKDANIRSRRSANVERDAGSWTISQYVPTSIAVDTLSRFLGGLEDPINDRAFSLTGPYGAGKSSFAVYLQALVGPRRSTATQDARRILGGVNPSLCDRLTAILRLHGAEETGVLCATATAEREPIRKTVLRALANGIEGIPGSTPSARRRDLRSSVNTDKGTRGLIRAGRYDRQGTSDPHLDRRVWPEFGAPGRREGGR